MINRYDEYEPYHPDGPDDPDELPGGSATTISWLDDEDPLDDDLQATAPGSLQGESLNCGACGEPAKSWVYQVATGEDGSSVIDGIAVCNAHQVAA